MRQHWLDARWLNGDSCLLCREEKDEADAKLPACAEAIRDCRICSYCSCHISDARVFRFDVHVGGQEFCLRAPHGVHVNLGLVLTSQASIFSRIVIHCLLLLLGETLLSMLGDRGCEA
jgi:hypothetical protein